MCPRLSFSSDEHPLFSTLFGHRHAGWKTKHHCHYRASWDVRIGAICGLCVDVTTASTISEKDSKKVDPQKRAELGSAERRETVEEDTPVSPRFDRDPPPELPNDRAAGFCASSKVRARLQQRLSWTRHRCKTTVLIVAELDRCWAVTQDHHKASEIERVLHETQTDPKTETTFVSHSARRELNCQQLDNALGTQLPAVIKGYATLRDAKLTESSHDRVVMWTGGSYDCDDVMRALVRLDRPDMRPGTSGKDCSDILHQPRGGCSDTGVAIRRLDPTECRSATLGRGSRRLTRRCRHLRGRKRRRSRATERPPSQKSST